MAQTSIEHLPQVVAIAKVAAGKVSLLKRVRQELGTADESLYLRVNGEVVLSAQRSPQAVEATFVGPRLVLPDAVAAALEAKNGALLAMVQHEGGVALKRVTTEAREGAGAAAYDVETERRLVRVVEVNPMPEDAMPQLGAAYADLALQHDVRAFLQGRETLDAWRARRLLGIVEEGDERLRGRWTGERLAAQAEDGSWDGAVPRTAGTLRELHDLGLPDDDGAMRRGATWLLERPASAHNPGMWFGSDALVAEQARIVDQRKAGKGGRFREIRRSEQKQVIAGDASIRMPCGPRIMWPNALVLEVLLCLGCEGHERVQTALRTLTTKEWCECGYQHGFGDWRRANPLEMDEIAAYETECIARYRFGGYRSPEALLEATLAQRTHSLRLHQESTPAGEVYALRTPDHIQGCEFITTRALSAVQDPRARRYAEAHLWHFAGIQCPEDGAFPEERYGTGFSQPGILSLFARYEHPAARLVLLRALPWIAGAQNEDGSWGEGAHADGDTLAVVTSLLALGEDLPARMRP